MAQEYEVPTDVELGQTAKDILARALNMKNVWSAQSFQTLQELYQSECSASQIFLTLMEITQDPQIPEENVEMKEFMKYTTLSIRQCFGVGVPHD